MSSPAGMPVVYGPKDPETGSPIDATAGASPKIVHNPGSASAGEASPKTGGAATESSAGVAVSAATAALTLQSSDPRAGRIMTVAGPVDHMTGSILLTNTACYGSAGGKGESELLGSKQWANIYAERMKCPGLEDMYNMPGTGELSRGSSIQKTVAHAFYRVEAADASEWAHSIPLGLIRDNGAGNPLYD